MLLSVQTFLTLDGVMQAPGGPDEDPSGGFVHGGWQAPFGDAEVGEFILELNGHASAFLFGRRTFENFRGHWPDQTDPGNPIATSINSLPKYVVSNTLGPEELSWRGTHPDTVSVISGDTDELIAQIRRQKDEPGDELQIWGSGVLCSTLLQHDVIDRLRIITFPVILGSGRRRFIEGAAPRTLDPVDVRVSSTGVVLATYEPIGPVAHGQM